MNARREDDGSQEREDASRSADCPDCGGVGGFDCSNCSGTGIGRGDPDRSNCTICRGSGLGSMCERCRGSGSVAPAVVETRGGIQDEDLNGHEHGGES